MGNQNPGSHFFSFFPPYKGVEPLDHPRSIPRGHKPIRGAAVIWDLLDPDWGRGFRAVRDRPSGVALVLILPPVSEMEGTDKLLRLMEHCRPHTVLPHIDGIEADELLPILRRPPTDFPMEVADYLRWRGLDTDPDTRRLIHRTLALSGEIRTVSGLARGLYVSRRALGRRFLSRGLPVPSHWLHFGRCLRGCLSIQSGQRSLNAITSGLGYPDSFSFSNQLKRLTGLRPSVMRECFGWEWIVESWLHQEALSGTFPSLLSEHLFPGLRRHGDIPPPKGDEAEEEDRLLVAEKMRRAETAPPQ